MVSGLHHDTKAPYSDSVSLRLRLFNLTSHRNVTRRFILQRHALTRAGLELCCGHTVSGSISLPSRCFSAFPHGTGSLSVTRGVFRVGRWSSRFRQDFTCPAVLRILARYRIYLKYRLLLLFVDFLDRSL